MESQGTVVLEKGTKLGRYEIERLVGIGSMAAVYEAVDARTGKHLAIKVLSPALAAVPAARARFLKEAKLTARVRHPHIVEVSDVDENTTDAYFVMELLEGEDLAQRLHRSGPLSIQQTAELMVPVCDAVAEAHKHGITHRDLKPANIFLTTRDGRPHPVVLDFGIAMDERAARTLQGVGSTDGRRPVFGTPYYLAPELIEDHRTAGPKSDQYALGVILYECLTGEPPHRGETVEEVFRAIAGSNQNSARARRPDVSEELDAVVRRALSRDPDARYTWVAALGRALRPFAAGFGVPYRPTPSSGGIALEARALRPTPSTAASALEATKPVARRPTPSSPVITLEAMKPSPFVKTLTPEVEELDRAWFAAGDDLHKAPVEPASAWSDLHKAPVGTASASPIEIDVTPDAEPPPSGEVAAEIDATKSGGWRPTSRRVWIGVAGGASLAMALVALVVTRGSPSAAPPPQAALVPAVLPSSPVPSAPVAAEPPAAAKTEPPAPSEAPPPPAAAEPPAVAKSEPAPAPAEPPATAKTEPPAPAPAAPAVAKSEPPEPTETARAHKPAADRPHAPKAAGIRMHKGVPLLD